MHRTFNYSIVYYVVFVYRSAQRVYVQSYVYFENLGLDLNANKYSICTTHYKYAYEMSIAASR